MAPVLFYVLCNVKILKLVISGTILNIKMFCLSLDRGIEGMKREAQEIYGSSWEWMTFLIPALK